jgi:hypothetical protein
MATTTQTSNWVGKSGKTYTYCVYPLGTSFKEEPGNYIYAKEISPGRWVAKYIGQTKNLNQRLGGHEKEACAKRNGATHIHAHISADEQTRLAEERDLIQANNPPCNTQLTW